MAPRRTRDDEKDDRRAARAERGSRTSQRSRTRSRRRLRPRPSAGAYRSAAEHRLRNFRQRTALAVAVTGLALVLWGTGGATEGEAALAQDTAVVVDTLPADTAAAPVSTEADTAPDVSRSVGEAASTLRQLGRSAWAIAPKIGIAVVLLLFVAVLARAVRTLATRWGGSWQRANAVGVLASVALWLLALGAALAIIAGDARALLGSVGLIGLALSWALQAPIESFTGWLLNSFRAYYRVGDRIAVGDVFGDVFAIDLLTTTVWEAGGRDKAVQGAQPTGALITFPNSEVLRANIVNYTRDFEWVWDEVVVGVRNESDLGLAMRALGDAAQRTVGEAMAQPAAVYSRMLRAARLPHDIDTEPQLYVSPTDAWTNITIRYLVPARSRRAVATELFLACNRELARPEYADKVFPSYPRMEVDVTRLAE